MKLRLLLFLFGLAALSSAGAALTWENRTVELHPGINDKEAVARFKYKNESDKPVKITEVKPSCGCTTAALANPVVEPGASGEITATFHIGGRVGPQSKTIRVETDEPGSASTVLTLKANVPKVLVIAPAFLYWAKDKPLDPKTIEVKLGGDFPVKKIEVTSTDPDVVTETKPEPDDKGFKITVTPKSGHRPINAALKITPDFPKDPPKIFYANLRIEAHPDPTTPTPTVAK